VAAHAAADGDPLDVLPAFVFQQAPHDEGEFLREILDDAVDQTRRLRVAFFQRLIELFFTDLVAGPLERPSLIKGLRALSRIAASAFLLARSPRNPPLSLSSML
jgi:hypothetical protein